MSVDSVCAIAIKKAQTFVIRCLGSPQAIIKYEKAHAVGMTLNLISIARYFSEVVIQTAIELICISKYSLYAIFRRLCKYKDTEFS